MKIEEFQENLNSYKKLFEKGLSGKFKVELVNKTDFTLSEGDLKLVVNTPKEEVIITCKNDSNEIRFSKEDVAEQYTEFKNEKDFLDVVQSILVLLCN